MFAGIGAVAPPERDGVERGSSWVADSATAPQ
jgi:hypothetical protein